MKLDRGTAQARKAGRSGAANGGPKQADGGLAAAKEGVLVAGATGAVKGKKIIDVAEVAGEQAAGGAVDEQSSRVSVVRGGVPEAPSLAGGGRVVIAGKDEVRGTSTPVEVAGLFPTATVPSADGANVLQRDVQGAVGASVVAPKQAPVASGDGVEGAFGGWIRPELKGAVDLDVDVRNAESPVAAVTGRESARAALPDLAGGSGSEGRGKGLANALEEVALPGVGVKASAVKSDAVTSDAAATVPALTSSGVSSRIAGRSSAVEGISGISLPKTILKAREIPAGDQVAESSRGAGQVASVAKDTVAGLAVPAGWRTASSSGEKLAGSESAAGQKLSVAATGSSPSIGSSSIQGDSAAPVADPPVFTAVRATPGSKPGLGSFAATEAPTAIEAATETIVGGVAGQIDVGPGAEAVGTQALPVASAASDSAGWVAPRAIVAEVRADTVPNALPAVGAADKSGIAASRGALAEVVAQPVAAHRAGSGQDGSKTTAKSAGQPAETEHGKETIAAEAGGGKIALEASPTGVDVPAVVAAMVVPVASSPATPLVVEAEKTVGEGVREVNSAAGPVAGATSRSTGIKPAEGSAATRDVKVPESVTETVTSAGAGVRVAKKLSIQAVEVPTGPSAGQGGVSDAVLGIETRAPGSAPVEANNIDAREVAVAGGVASIAPVKAGQERRVAGGSASAGARERKGVAEDNKGNDAAGSAEAARAGRTGAVASSVDGGVGAVKPLAGEHRAPASGGGQTSDAPVASAAVASGQTHESSALAANVSTAAAVPSSKAVVETSIGGPSVAPSGSAAGAAGDSLISPMAHTTLQATPTVLEVGVPGGTHGWLKIRAEIGEGGAVQASMSATSHAGQDALRRDLPAINAFLESEHVPVSVQVVHGTGSSWLERDGAMTQAGFGPGGGVDAGLGQSSGQGGQGPGRDGGAGMLADAGGGEGRQPGAGSSAQGGMVAGVESQGQVATQSVNEGDAAWSPAPGYGSGVRANGGSWLNVVA